MEHGTQYAYKQRCRCEECRDWKQRDNQARNDRNRAGHYGLSVETMEGMFLAQDGKCACCGAIAARLGIDHSHITGAVRALVCRSCNQRIGHVESGTGIIRTIDKLIELLKQQRQITDYLATHGVN